MFAGFLATAAVLEALSAWVGQHCSNDVAEIAVPLKLEWIENGRAEAAIVLVGDSFVEMGVDPGVIRDTTGLSAVNLGTILPVSLYGQHFVLRRYFDKFRPRAVVLIVDADIFSRHLYFAEHDRYYMSFSFLRWNEILYTFAATRDSDLLLSQILHKLLPLPSLEYRSVAQAVAGDILRFTQDGDRSLVAARLSGQRAAAVRTTFDRRDGMFPVTGRTYSPASFDERPFRVTPPMAAELDRIMELCRTRGVPLLFGLSALPESVLRYRQLRGLQDGIDAFAQGIRERHPEVHLFQPLQPVFADAEFYDRRHLLPHAASVYSQSIADRLAVLFRGPGL